MERCISRWHIMDKISLHCGIGGLEHFVRLKIFFSIAQTSARFFGVKLQKFSCVLLEILHFSSQDFSFCLVGIFFQNFQLSP